MAGTKAENGSNVQGMEGERGLRHEEPGTENTEALAGRLGAEADTAVSALVSDGARGLGDLAKHHGNEPDSDVQKEMSGLAALAVDASNEFRNTIGVKEKVESGSEALENKIAELKEKAKQEYEQVVKPLIAELRAKLERMPDGDPQFASVFENDMKNAETFFSLEDNFHALNQDLVNDLRKAVEKLSFARTAKEVQQAYNTGATNDLYMIINQPMWGSGTININWESRAKDELGIR